MILLPLAFNLIYEPSMPDSFQIIFGNIIKTNGLI